MSRYDDNEDPGGYDAPPGAGASKPRKRRRSRKRRIIGWIAAITTVLVTGSSLAAYAAYLNTWHSVDTFSTKTTLGNNRPPAYDASENILVVGSDSRAGSNKKFGANVQGQRSDTMMLLHIRPNHRGAVVISLPRDLEVPVYKCAADGLGDPGQPYEAGAEEMLNASFAYGGPPCLWHTIEQVTGIRIDHYLGLTFTGFEKVINAIGGVNVCLPIAIHDPKSGIDLTAGEHHVKGGQALAFWRERYVGEGSDLQRIQRQQYLMAGLMQEVKTGGLLTDYTKLYGVLKDASKALTADNGLTVTALVSLGEDLHSISESSIQFVTVPNGADPTDQNRVILTQPQASNLFYSVAHDTTLPSGKKSSSSSSPTSQATTSPGNVQVEVLNGNGQQGAAAQAASDLTNHGFKVVSTGNATSQTYTGNVIEYSSASDLTDVNTLKEALGGTAQVQQEASLTPGTVYLIIGSDFNGLTGSTSSASGTASTGTASTGASPSPSSSSSSSSSDNLSKTYGGINGSANICHDSGAFAGPDNPANGT